MVDGGRRGGRYVRLTISISTVLALLLLTLDKSPATLKTPLKESSIISRCVRTSTISPGIEAGKSHWRWRLHTLRGGKKIVKSSKVKKMKPPNLVSPLLKSPDLKSMSISGTGKERDGKPREGGETSIEAEEDKLKGIAAQGHSSAKKDSYTKDIRIERISLQYYEKTLLEDTSLVLNYGNRYGLIGRNGCGKSILLKALANKGFQLPMGMSLYHLRKELDPTNDTALEAVMSAQSERKEIETRIHEIEKKMEDTGGDEDEKSQMEDQLAALYESLNRLEDRDSAKPRAISILRGLGFGSEAMLNKKTREFSGGWRMRIALARALFLEPEFLILDEPTNHLDMESVVWLENYLKGWRKLLLMVSHSQDFMNGVCTHMIRFVEKKLVPYTGNYDQYVKTRQEKETQQQKQYEAEQKDIAQLKEFVAKFGHGTKKLAAQGKSREKILNRKIEAGLTAPVAVQEPVDFEFGNPGKLPTPLLTIQEVSFGYSPDRLLYENVDFGLDPETRLALLGPNGAGKSTLLKLMTRELQPTAGKVGLSPNLKIAKFTQHFADILDEELTPLEFMDRLFPEKGTADMRRFLGRFGISGDIQTTQIKFLSEGQKARVVFSKINLDNPQLLLLDEPTNALDMESIDALARALQTFKGAVVLVSHDMRLISQVAKQIFVVDKKCVTPFQGTIMDFKKNLQNKLSGDIRMSQGTA
ncbi:hypothetical protein AAMO2058_000417800 [Amorphochlora amoebiformis]